ncbi:MAG: hypothetical protein ACYC0O_06065 [Desulfurivibrionaceae bacterium]|nr:hypothetical protein [Pseudomonadota bacterium]MBU4407862.1 hypothetical protein [Pseudomonadota bacterium]MBU4412784.1 hypothetical protein [Pseudomonadota bacterium]MCG2823996.1 hypothetical protein [Desulfobulbaceae bacterium]PKN22454.1 MAG: hypothetical protein CVU68_04210 [Deltaproteobacteria bacterium HGW-Deltaproteobacteria-3]
MIREAVDARTVRIGNAAAWELLRKAAKITVAKGKQLAHLHPQQDGKEEILKQVMGPSGNLRAPALRVDDEFVVGFHPDFYRQWLQGK